MSEIKPVAWFTEDHLTDRSATTYDTEVVERWQHKGWPVSGLVLHSDHEAEVARLSAEVEKNRVDAERYRWLRSPFATNIESIIGMHCDGELDYQIDKAMGDPA
ncbi:hypothetical protein [Stenotrophomonas maltophilia]|uniref:hypothetical protein n=1 Tax=Stenotrophomonas maltophilia TaxID=40324 RepID=UPI003BF89E1F